MRRISYILLAVFSLSTPIYSADFVVPDGKIEKTTQSLGAPGDTGIIEEGGAIVVEGIDAVTMSNDTNQTVFNQGSIATTGNGARGIFNDGGTEAVITNSGRILTAGDSADGICNDGGANAVITNSGQILTAGDLAPGIRNISGANEVVITNSGQISTTGLSAFGITNSSNELVIMNSGQISTEGDNSHGISNGGDDSVITNSGQISTEGGNSHGIESLCERVVITNSGQISTTGDDAHGIFNDGGTEAVITNSGLILTKGEDADGIRNDDGADIHIINSGTIRSAQSFALNLLGTNPTLSLLRGSNLQGRVFNDDPLNLNVETGLNLALKLDSGNAGFNDLGIEAPFIRVGDTIGVIDPTGLAMQADVVADLSDTILNGIYRHRTAFSCQCTPCGCGVWAQGIGSYRERSRNKDTVGHDNWQGGFLVGYDTPLYGGNVSLFGGVSFGEAEVDEQTQKANTTSYVGGLTYERLFCNTFLGLALAVGYVDWDNERFVMNNLASGGVEKARTDTGGVFVSPEVTLAHFFSSLWCSPTMSFTLRYAGLFLGDYTEKGSLTNLSVKDREIDLLTTRFELSVPYTASRGICCWSIEPYLGVSGRYQVGGNRVDAELLGQSLSFDPGSPRNLAAFLLGFRGIQSFGCFNLFLNLEGSFDSCRSSRILGEGGIGFCF